MGGIGSAMAGCRAMAVLGQVSASWCIPDSGVSQTLVYPRVSDCNSPGGPGSHIFTLVLVSGPGPSGGQDYVQWETR